MGVGVVADLMPAGMDFLHQLRVFIHPDAHQEEGCPGPVFVEQVKYLPGLAAAPGRVEGNGNHAVLPLHTVDRQLTPDRQHLCGAGLPRPRVAYGEQGQGAAQRNLTQQRPGERPARPSPVFPWGLLPVEVGPGLELHGGWLTHGLPPSFPHSMHRGWRIVAGRRDSAKEARI